MLSRHGKVSDLLSKAFCYGASQLRVRPSSVARWPPPFVCELLLELAMYDRGNALTSSNPKLSFVQYHEIYVRMEEPRSSIWHIYTHMDGRTDTSLVEQAKLAPLGLTINVFEPTDHDWHQLINSDPPKVTTVYKPYPHFWGQMKIKNPRVTT